MPYPCLWKEATFVAGFHDAIGEVDVFTESHLGKSAQFQVNFASDTHVIRTWIELVELLFSAAYSSGSEETGHGIRYCFLHISERRVGSISASEGIARVVGEFFIDCFQVIARQHHVAVEYNKVFALGTLGAIVAALPRSGVFLEEILQVESV